MMHTAFPAYLAGALLILIPVVLHLLKRKVTVPVPFPSFFFLKKTAAGRQRRNSLRKYLILLCRCLAFLFLAYAFAYPHASAVVPAPAEATIVVLDCSFSTEPLQTQMRTALEKVLKAASPEHPMLIAAAGGQLLWSGDFSADRAALASWAQERMSRPQSSAFASALAMVDNRLGTIPAKKKTSS
ncbi:MAG: BatA domain-containing protein [Lentisphaeria bacterium]|nr:MAG: BatA domain-containing protein [Lentisphaeria bacterium]